MKYSPIRSLEASAFSEFLVHLVHLPVIAIPASLLAPQYVFSAVASIHKAVLSCITFSSASLIWTKLSSTPEHQVSSVCCSISGLDVPTLMEPLVPMHVGGWSMLCEVVHRFINQACILAVVLLFIQHLITLVVLMTAEVKIRSISSLLYYAI